MKIPDFETKKERLAFLKENKQKLIAAKKDEIKRGDGVPFTQAAMEIETIDKAEAGQDDILQVKAVINTTNLLDSHMDVHLPGIWDKSLKENKMIMHIQEHKMEFEKIIADGKDLKVTLEEIKWKDLGWNFEGKTQALVFTSKIRKDRNPYMEEQYRKNRVNNHSVGMRYVRLLLAMNDEEYAAEFDAWEKYYPEVANKERADELGYFWVVKEAKIIEGSAVPLGSNPATPTLDIKDAPEEESTHPPAPEKSTQDQIEVKTFFNSLNF